MEILRTPPPPLRKHKRRLTDEIRALQPGDSFKTDRSTANSVRAHFRKRGLDAITRMQDDGQIQVWIVERD